MSPGYSSTPLARKLGIKEGMRILLIDAPKDYHALVDGVPASVDFAAPNAREVDMVHCFVTSQKNLRNLAKLKDQIRPAGMIWVSWPKKSSGIVTGVTEDVIREAALAAGLVDVKVCAVDDVWSGLKLVIRTADRPAAKPPR